MGIMVDNHASPSGSVLGSRVVIYHNIIIPWLPPKGEAWLSTILLFPGYRALTITWYDDYYDPMYRWLSSCSFYTKLMQVY